MGQRERIIEYFRNHGHRATLGELLAQGFYECRARFTELRGQGFKIVCEQNRLHPTRNLYTMTEPVANEIKAL